MTNTHTTWSSQTQPPAIETLLVLDPPLSLLALVPRLWILGVSEIKGGDIRPEHQESTLLRVDGRRSPPRPTERGVERNEFLTVPGTDLLSGMSHQLVPYYTVVGDTDLYVFVFHFDACA